jgi:hypothetical protein
MATTVNAGSAASVRADIRRFFDRLVRHQQLPPGGGAPRLRKQWSRSVLFLRKAVSSIHASCRHYDDPDDLEARTWNMYVPNQYLQNAAQLAQYVAAQPTPAWLTQELAHCAAPAMRAKTRHKLVLLQLWPVFNTPAAVDAGQDTRVRVRLLGAQQDTDMHWRSNAAHGNHSTLLMFDIARGTQEFFDPHGEQGEAIQYAAAFAARAPLVPGVCPRVLPLTRAGGGLLTIMPANGSLQRTLTAWAGVNDDLCSATCYMVAFVSLRYGIVYLNLCARLIAGALESLTLPAARSLLRRFIMWCNANLGGQGGGNASNSNSNDDDAANPFQRVIYTGSRCVMVGRTTGKRCTRKRCGVPGPYCWQHRHLWRNPFAVPPKRMACKKPLRLPPRPAGVPAGALV